MFKKILKNKKGSTVVLSCILLPTIVLIFYGIISNSIITSYQSKKMQTLIDNSLYYASNEYGQRSMFYNNLYCNFEEEDFGDEGEMKEYFQALFTSYDGYNTFWEIESFEINENKHLEGTEYVYYDASKTDNNEYVYIKLKIVLPNIRTNYYGISSGYSSSSMQSGGWYSNNFEYWKAVCEEYVDSGYTGDLLIFYVEGASSCY